MESVEVGNVAVMLIKALFVIVPFHKSAVLALLKGKQTGERSFNSAAYLIFYAEDIVCREKICKKIFDNFHGHVCSLADGGFLTVYHVLVLGRGRGTENKISVAVVDEHIKAEACVFFHYRSCCFLKIILIERVLIIFIKVTAEPCSCHRPE